MFARIAVVAAALAAAPSAFADTTVKDLSQETGVRERYIRMVTGGRTGYAEYRVVFDRVERQLKNALGQDGYHYLLRGETAAALEARHQHIAAQASATRQVQPARQQQG